MYEKERERGRDVGGDYITTNIVNVNDRRTFIYGFHVVTIYFLLTLFPYTAFIFLKPTLLLLLSKMK